MNSKAQRFTTEVEKVEEVLFAKSAA